MITTLNLIRSHHPYGVGPHLDGTTSGLHKLFDCIDAGIEPYPMTGATT